MTNPFAVVDLSDLIHKIAIEIVRDSSPEEPSIFKDIGIIGFAGLVSILRSIYN
jgi:hypothetical protein